MRQSQLLIAVAIACAAAIGHFILESISESGARGQNAMDRQGSVHSPPSNDDSLAAINASRSEISPSNSANTPTSRIALPGGEAVDEIAYASSLDYLKDFWGPDWEWLQESVAKEHPERIERYRNMIVTRDLVPPPLSEVMSEFRARVLAEFDSPEWQWKRAWVEDAEPWPENPTDQFLQERLRIGPQELTKQQWDELSILVAHHEAGLDPVRQQFFHLGRAALERELSIDAVRAWPLLKAGPGLDPRTGLMGAPVVETEAEIRIGVSMNGLWLIAAYVWGTDYPELRDLRLELEKLGEARLREVRRFLGIW